MWLRALGWPLTPFDCCGAHGIRFGLQMSQ